MIARLLTVSGINILVTDGCHVPVSGTYVQADLKISILFTIVTLHTALLFYKEASTLIGTTNYI